MSYIRDVIRSSGLIQSWTEKEEIFTVSRDSQGKPKVVSSRLGKWGKQESTFNYDSNGNFLGMSVPITSLMLPTLIEEASGSVKAKTNPLTERIELFANGEQIDIAQNNQGSRAWYGRTMYGMVFEGAARAPQLKTVVDRGVQVVSPVSVAGVSDWTGFTLPDMQTARLFPRSVSIDVYCEDWSKVEQIVYYMGTTGYAKTAIATWNATATGQSIGQQVAGKPGWRTLWKSLADCATSGAPDFAVDQMTVHKTRTYSVVGSAADMVWGEIRFEDNDIPSISICADDGWASWYTQAGPILDGLGLKASMAIIPDLVGTSNYVTWDECRNWISRGHRIVTHGCRSGLANLTMYASISEAVADAVWSRQRIRDEGCDVDGSADFYVFPQGAYNWGGTYRSRELTEALIAAGFKGGRSTGYPQFFHSQSIDDDATKMVMPIIGHSWSSGDEAGNITAIVSRIDAAATYKHSASLVFHIIAASPTVSTQITPANFTTIVNRLAYWSSYGKLTVPLIHKQIGQSFNF